MKRSDDRSTGGTEQLAILPCVDELLDGNGGSCENLYRNLEIKLILRVENALDSAEPPKGLGSANQLERTQKVDIRK